VIPQLLEPGLAALDALTDFDSLCLLVTEDERPLGGAAGLVDWRLCGALSRLLKDSFFRGTPDERLLMPSLGRVPVERVFAVGLGRAKAVTALGFEHSLAAAAQMLERAAVQSVALALPSLPQLGPEATAALVRRAFCDTFAGRKVAVFADAALGAKLVASASPPR
jgi:hypothetical protein